MANLGITSKDAGECCEVRDSEVKLLKCVCGAGEMRLSLTHPHRDENRKLSCYIELVKNLDGADIFFVFMNF